jgi:hypothetical protein
MQLSYQASDGRLADKELFPLFGQLAGPTRKIQSQTLAAFLALYEFQLVGALI